jgi:hypothetical protein
MSLRISQRARDNRNKVADQYFDRPLPGATDVGEEEGPSTRGHRVYLIREALGTRRDPMPLPKFAELIKRTSGVSYDKSTLSRMETGERKVSLDDIEAIAPVDPLKRGKAWLAGWDEEGGQGTGGGNQAPPPITRVHVNDVTTKRIEVPTEKPGRKRRPDKGNDRSARAS